MHKSRTIKGFFVLFELIIIITDFQTLLIIHFGRFFFKVCNKSSMKFSKGCEPKPYKMVLATKKKKKKAPYKVDSGLHLFFSPFGFVNSSSMGNFGALISMVLVWNC